MPTPPSKCSSIRSKILKTLQQPPDNHIQITNCSLQPTSSSTPPAYSLTTAKHGTTSPQIRKQWTISNNFPTSTTRITQSTTHSITSRFPSQWDLVPTHQKQRNSPSGNRRSPGKFSNSHCVRLPSTPKLYKYG